MTTEAPMIVTLQLDKESQDHFNRLRKLHFPARFNFLDAHLTLFHHLPASQPAIIQEIDSSVRTAVFEILVSDVYHTGYGVAFRLHSKILMQLHNSLQEAFYSWLSPQDRQPFRPHVTIQNKVSAQESKALTAALQESFSPFTAMATGINTWLYRNGPWQHLEFFGFQKEHATH